MKSETKTLGGMLRGVLAGLAVMAGATGAQAQEVEWQFASAYGDNTVVTENIRLFIEEVETASDGRFQIVLHNNAKLFKMPEIKRAVQTGQVQIGEILLSAYGNEDPLFEVDVLPTLAQTPEEAARLWELSKDGITERFEKNRVKALFAHYWTGQGFFSKEPIETVEDLAGTKQRVMNPSGAKWAEMMGATGVLVQYAEIGQALALGTVDSFFAAPAAVIDSKAWESLNYFYPVGLMRGKGLVLVNQRAYDALPDDLRAIVDTAAQNAADRALDMATASEDEAYATLEANGMTRDEFPPEVTAKINELGSEMISEWAERAGDEGVAIVEGMSAN
ncbi:TRAP transporter substrate-binding protein [Celeribacter naphthalenivorans]|uniref:TRAP transporter substrate-binding protein n=1 Tax=Celeribacter naphthalenivorans TaxID=1614694 RepID=UPI001CFB4C17|nr:TRAP transporter substrate-binding protein [Celeribacter naphthalenivorans]